MNRIGANLFLPYAAMSLILAASLLGGAVCVFFGVSLIRRQIRLTRSIILVELKSDKTLYLFFMAIVAALIVAAIFAFGGASGKSILTDADGYGMAEWQAVLSLAFLLLLLLSVGFLLAALFVAKSAVTDLGVYAALTFFEWHRIRDYVIDESKGIVVIGTRKETFSTVKGITVPLKVKKNDITKLKFILNKNKNKFTI